MPSVPHTTDRSFLRRILFLMVVSTIITGAIATSAIVMAGHGSLAPAHEISISR